MVPFHAYQHICLKNRINKSLPNLIHKTENDGTAITDIYQYIFNSHLSKVAQWESVLNGGNYNSELHEAIFNLEFSPDGKMLLCACENKSILSLDPHSHKKINMIQDAHDDCVNCIRFIDSRTFASCSDDKTISLWDVRKLTSVFNSLKGHSSWVKSIEYNQSSGQLLSSAFDDTVRLWNLNSYCSDGTIRGEIALKLKALVRTKLSTDFSKLFLTTTSGMGIIIIHNVNLQQIANDCESLDLLIEQGDQHALRRPVNRIEKISEFPGKRQPGCLYSIDVHPYCWCILSRYADVYGRSEFTCVHDVQDYHIGGCNVDCSHGSSYLTYFIEEPNAGRGYIKELCFNSDGRLICSPFGNGVRLLAFDKYCNELSTCATSSPVHLTEIKTLVSHKKTVLTTKFSPCLPMLTAGCLDGCVSFHLPKL